MGKRNKWRAHSTYSFVDELCQRTKKSSNPLWGPNIWVAFYLSYITGYPNKYSKFSIVCRATPSVLISKCEDILVSNIVSWNFVGTILSGARKWFSGWNEIRRHWPPTSICILCAFCSWGKRRYYCLGLIAQ